MTRRLRALTRKELRQLLRDPILLILVGWLYTVEVLLCAYSLTFDLNDAPIAVEDLDGTPESRALTDRLDRSADFGVAVHANGRADLTALLDRAQVVAVVRIPRGWGRGLYRQSTAGQEPIQLVVDGADSATAASVRGYLQALILQQRLDVEGSAFGRRVKPRIASQVRIWFNSDLKTVYFMVISMIAMAAIMVGVIHPAATLVREREMGTLDQLLVTPLRPWELVLSKLFVTLLAALVGLTLSLAIIWWFDVPLRGSVVTFYAISIVFQISSIGLGIFIATLSKNLQQALLLAFFGLIPVMFLSGTMVPVEAMPRPVQVASLLSPLRYYMDCLLGVFLKGSGWRLLWPQVASMAALGTLLLGAGLLRLRRGLGA